MDRLLSNLLGVNRRINTPLRTPAEIEMIRTAGRVVHDVLTACGEAVRPGITTADLDDIAIRLISEHRGSSPFLGYTPGEHPPFPAWTCVSVNEEIVHGIPGSRVLREGDIVTVDCGVEIAGYIGDSAWTYPVGRVSPLAEKLLRVTHEALMRGIAQARPHGHIGDIGHAIQKYAESYGFSVVRELNGHGVGTSLHEELQVPNFGSRGEGPELTVGMVFAIEPMINAGRKEIESLEDGWTISTADRSLSAHFEHTVAITPQGATILTNGE